jgi:hypothetical protein
MAHISRRSGNPAEGWANRQHGWMSRKKPRRERLRLSFCDFSHRPRGASDASSRTAPRGAADCHSAHRPGGAFERSPALQRWGKRHTRFESRRDDRFLTHSSPELFMATNPLATIATRHRIIIYIAPITHDLLSNQQHRLTTTHSHSYN